MKHSILKFKLSLILSLIYSLCFSQDDNVSLDKGISYDTDKITNESITVPLYNVSIDGASIPIFLSYNTIGFKVSDVPSNVGFNWSLHAGGGIEKQTKHLSDESANGWFFNKNIKNIQVGEYTGGYPGWYTGEHPENPSRVFEHIDTAPDMFNMRISNGFFLDYMYKRLDNSDNQNSVVNLDLVILNQDRNASVDTNFYRLSNYSYDYKDDIYNSDNECEIRINDGLGVNYLFRKGEKRERPWDLENRRVTFIDSTFFNNYYLHKVSTIANNQSISFEYLDTKLKKFISHAYGKREQTNSDPMNPPHPNDPVVTSHYESGISVEDVSRKEIKRIVSNKEIVEFIYKIEFYGYNIDNIIASIPSDQSIVDRHKNQSIRLLDEIKVFDHNGNYIMGYKFNYTEQTDNPVDYEGDLKLKSILKFGKNHKDYVLYREFDYGFHNRPSPITVAQDVFGYYNGEINNAEDNITPIYLSQGISNKLPNETHLTAGMLKTITTKNGGKTELEYKENSFGDIYYGGLLVDAINIRDRNNNLLSRVEYNYEEPEGFGLPVYNTEFDQTTNRPMYMYEDGFYESQQPIYSWETYFTKREYNTMIGEIGNYTVRSTPYKLMKNTPFLNVFINELMYDTQDQELSYFNQLENGVIYKKVTEKKINALNNQQEKGKVITYHEPSINGYNLNSQISKIEYYNNEDKKVSETQYNYQKLKLESIPYYDLDRVGTRNFVDYGWIFNIKDVLKGMTTKNYDLSGTFQNQQNTTFEYLNENEENISTNYNKFKNVVNYFNDEEFSKTEYKYMSESTIFDTQYQQELRYLYKINPLIEKNNWIKSNESWKLESSSATSYLFDGKPKHKYYLQKNPATGQFYNETNFTPVYFDTQGNLVSQAEDVVEYVYDDNGNLLAEKDLQKSINTIYQRSEEYNGLYVDAILTTNQNYQNETNYFVKKSFENTSEANHIKFAKAFSGEGVYNGDSIDLGAYPSGYTISYWSYENNKWKFNTSIHQAGNVIITKPSNALYIDEIIVKPKYSAISSLTLKPIIGSTSALNNRGEGERIEYDIYGKPLYVFDINGNVIKEYRTNSINQNLND